MAAISGHQSSLNTATFSADGKVIVTASCDHTARIWDGHIGKLVVVLTGHKAWVTGVAFSPDGSKLVTVGRDGLARIYPWEAFVRMEDLQAAEPLRRLRPLTPEERWRYLHDPSQLPDK